MKRLITLILTLIMLYAIALADEPATTMIGAANVPSIPAGTLSASLVSFTSNQTYPVYSAPDSKSVRGAKDRARVSTNGWIQVFGSESDWILVQYDITDTLLDDERFEEGQTQRMRDAEPEHEQHTTGKDR